MESNVLNIGILETDLDSLEDNLETIQVNDKNSFTHAVELSSARANISNFNMLRIVLNRNKKILVSTYRTNIKKDNEFLSETYKIYDNINNNGIPPSVIFYRRFISIEGVYKYFVTTFFNDQ